MISVFVANIDVSDLILLIVTLLVFGLYNRSPQSMLADCRFLVGGVKRCGVL